MVPQRRGTEVRPRSSEEARRRSQSRRLGRQASTAYPNTITGQNLGIATQTMLQAVGIDAQLDTSKDANGMANSVIVDKNFDVAS